MKNLLAKKYDHLKRKTFQIEILVLITCIFLVIKVNNQLPPPIWFDDDITLKNLNSPYEFFSKLDLQNYINLKSDFIVKKVLKLGLKYSNLDDSENLVPSYIVVFMFENTKRNQRIFCGLEYLPTRDGLLKILDQKGSF